jgi:hypothetical protein
MSTVLRNIGSLENNETNTNLTKSFGQRGVSRFVFEGVEYCCGVNAAITVEDRLATAWLAADSKMKFISRS